MDNMAEIDGEPVSTPSKDMVVASAPQPSTGPMTAPLVMKLGDPPNGGILKNGGVLFKARNYKAGSKINLLADMLAKRSLQMVVTDNGNDSVPCATTESLPVVTAEVCAAETKTEEATASTAATTCSSTPITASTPIPEDAESTQEQTDILSPSTAFIESDKSTNEKPQKTRTSPRCRKEVAQTDSQTKKVKARKPYRRNKLLVETSTQTAEAAADAEEPVQEPVAAASENVPPLPLNQPTIPPEEMALAMVVTMSKLPEYPTFVCLFCHLTFTEKTDCLNHEATHSLKRKTKFIKCQFCSKKLPNLEDFKTHSTEYHGPSFILCTECDLRFLNHESLVLHTKSNHHTYEHVERAQYTILNKKVRTGGALDIDVSFESGKKQTLSPRCAQKLSPKEKSEEQLYEAEMLFYSHLSGNIQENLSKHLDGKINQLENGIDIIEANRGSALLTVVPTAVGGASVPISRAPSPYQTRSKTPNPLPTSAKKFKKLPNWQQKFWEKYNFPTNYRFEHRFWDKNYINTEKSALYLKDLSCLDIKTQLTMRENVKKLEEAPIVNVTSVEDERLKETFPYCLNLMPATKTVAKPAAPKLETTKVVKKTKGRRKEVAGAAATATTPATPQVMTRRQSQPQQQKKVDDEGNTQGKKMTLRRQTSQESAQTPAKNAEASSSKDTPDEQEILEPSEISGEWVRPRSYLCGTCCAQFSNFWDLDDHKWIAHPNVSCTHYEFEDEKVRKVLQLDMENPGVAKISLSDLYQRSLLPQGSLCMAETIAVPTFPHPCSKCQKLSHSQSELHKHMLDCGGDTTWATTMTSSPATMKRRWRPYRSRRRKQMGQRGVKRTIPPTPPLRKYSLQPRIRTKPGDVETIQKMLANLPEKRTRRAINFDEVNTRSQTTIHSNRLLRKRFNPAFGSTFLRRKAISTARQRQLKSTSSGTTSGESGESTPSDSPRRRFRLKEVTVNVTPLPIVLDEPTSSSAISVKQQKAQTNGKRKKNTVPKKTVKEEDQEIVSALTPSPPPNKKEVNKKIVARKGYLARKIKQRLINSKKPLKGRASRRRSERINGNVEVNKDEEFTLEESVLPIAKLTEEKKPKQKAKKLTKLKVAEISKEMPILNKEEQDVRKKRRSGRRAEQELPVLKPVEVKEEPQVVENEIVVVKKARKPRVVKQKTAPVVEVIKEEQPTPIDSPSDTEPLIALKIPVKKKALKRGKGKKQMTEPVVVVEPSGSLAVPMDQASFNNLMMERIITEKLNERIGKRSKSGGRHRRPRIAPQPNLKRLRMTVTLKEATLKVLDKPPIPLTPSKWTVSSPDQLTNPTTFVPLTSEEPLSPDTGMETDKEHLKNGLKPPLMTFVSECEPVTQKEEMPMAAPLMATKVVEEIKETLLVPCDSIVKPQVIPIFTIEEATSSEDANIIKPVRGTVCEAKIAEADSSGEKMETTKIPDLDPVEPEMVVSSTEPAKPMPSKSARKRREPLPPLPVIMESKEMDSGKDEVPSSTLVIPEELDRRSRRRSKEVASTNEFVIDDPLILVDELWSDLDSDSDSKQKNRKVKRVKKKMPRKKPLRQKQEVDLEAILRNFGENKDNEEESIKRLPPKRLTLVPAVTSRQRIENKTAPLKGFLKNLSLNLFSHNKKIVRNGHNGEKLMAAKKLLENSKPKIAFLATEVTENPEQVIVCRSVKAKVKKSTKDSSDVEGKTKSRHLKVSLPLDLIGDLSMLNNNHLSSAADELTDTPPQEPMTEPTPPPPTPPPKPTDGKPKRSEVIDRIFYCEICKTYYYSPSQLKNHKMSNRHKLKEAELLGSSSLKLTPTPEPSPPLPEPAQPVETVVEPTVSQVDKNGEDSSEMPVLEGPFIETRPEPQRVEPSSLPLQHQPQQQPSLFGFSEESLKDIQQAIGCTDDEMLILTLLGENTVPEPDILDISNLTTKAEEVQRTNFDVLMPKTNGISKIDLKQRMTTALASLVNRAVTNLLSKSESCVKTADNPDTKTFLNKLSGISGRRRSVTVADLSLLDTSSSTGGASDVQLEVRYKHQCMICGNRFEKKSTRDNHMVRTHRVGKRGKSTGKIEPDDAGPINDDWSESWYEPDDDDAPTQFWCSECGINFQSPREVSDHQKAAHPPVEVVQPPAIFATEDIKDISTSATCRIAIQKRVTSLHPDQERLLANQELQKLMARKRVRRTAFGLRVFKPRKSLISAKVEETLVDKEEMEKPVISAVPTPSPSPTPSLVEPKTTPKLTESKSVDVYDFNEFDSDPEPVMLAHVRKSAVREAKETVTLSDSDDDLPLSSVKKPKLSGELAKEGSSDSQEGRHSKESFKISLQNRFLRLDELAVKKSSPSEDSIPTKEPGSPLRNLSPVAHNSDSDDPIDDNVIYQRNESSSDRLSDSESSLLSENESEERSRRKIVPLLSATLTDNLNRKSESPKIDKEVIVKKIWSRQKCRPVEEDSDIDKEMIMKKVWKKKRNEESQGGKSGNEDVKISQTEISNEVVIQCGPKPKINRRKSSTEATAKDAIMRRIWTGKCAFQTKAALKTYDTDMLPVPIEPVQSATPGKRRRRPVSMSATKRKKESSDTEDDLKSLLDEIEQENVEKAIRSEFLHLRRTEKSQTEEPSGLFTEIQQTEVVPEKKRKIRKTIRRRIDMAELRNRHHKKHRHRHHHKHKHKKSRHRKGAKHRESEMEAPFRILERMCTDFVPKEEGNPSTLETAQWSASEPHITSDLDNLQLKIDEILSPFDCQKKS